jgi:hypothetical protein
MKLAVSQQIFPEQLLQAAHVLVRKTAKTQIQIGYNDLIIIGCGKCHTGTELSSRRVTGGMQLGFKLCLRMGVSN